MSTQECAKLVIEGVREDGQKFRPSDWIERISGLMAQFGPDHRLHYSDRVQPSIINGVKCLVVDNALQAENPEGYQYILSFARANSLRIYEAAH